VVGKGSVVRKSCEGCIGELKGIIELCSVIDFGFEGVEGIGPLKRGRSET